MRRSLVVGALTVAVLAVTTACHQKGEPGVVVATGHVEATDVRLSTKVGGTLNVFPLDEGDRVQQGEEIARIDTVDLELALAAARAERDAAAADLALKQAGYRSEDVAEGRARLAQAKTDLEAAQRDLERFQGLLDAGSGTVKARDDARTRRDVARQQVKAVGEQVRKLEAGFRPEEIAAARARRDAAEARIAQIQQQIHDASVTSPLTGVVTETMVEPGELVSAGTALAVVSDLAHPWLTAWIAEPDLGKVRLGQQATVVTDDGRERVGTLGYVSSEAEFTPKNVQTRDERTKLVYKIKIYVDNADGLFKPGMPATARLETQPAAATPRPS